MKKEFSRNYLKRVVSEVSKAYENDSDSDENEDEDEEEILKNIRIYELCCLLC